MSPSRPGSAALLLPGVDYAAFAVALTARLRQRGVPVGLTGIEDFVRALEASPPDSLPGLYWAGRISLVRRRSEIEIFDAVFAPVFGGAGPAFDLRPYFVPRTDTTGGDDAYAPVRASSTDRPHGGGLPWMTLPPAVADTDDSDTAFAVPARLPSDIIGAADAPFEQLDARAMELLGKWLESAVAQWPTRRSRRCRASPRGHQISVRATMNRSRRTGWEPMNLVRVRAIDKPRPVLMLCDVSQSMQAQVPAYFHLMRALALVADAEVFAFATTLTRLTTALTHKSAPVAIEQATRKVTDRFGGTRIATNVQALLSSHHGGAARGAIVIIGSDGWDSDSPDALSAAMSRLNRRAHRVIWMNPRASAPDFEPRVAGMAAALPYCDKLLPADTFRSLQKVIAQVSRGR